MKIEKINENIIKVTISLNDLRERNIDLSTLNYNSQATQELFWDMMELAEIQFGFTASDSQLVFEASSNSEEGFIITITRLEADGDFESIQKYIKSKLRTSDLKNKKKTRKIYSTLIIYSFDKFEDLCALSKRICMLYSGDSSLYKLKDTYYLVLTKSSLTVANIKFFENILNEYGKKVTNTHFYEGYLNEYGTRIIENIAVETINTYF